MDVPEGIALPQLSTKVFPSLPVTTDNVYVPGGKGDEKFRVNALVKAPPARHALLLAELMLAIAGLKAKSLPFVANEEQVTFSLSKR